MEILFSHIAFIKWMQWTVVYLVAFGVVILVVYGEIRRGKRFALNAPQLSRQNETSLVNGNGRIYMILPLIGD
jgi:hypothetical protein